MCEKTLKVLMSLRKSKKNCSGLTKPSLERERISVEEEAIPGDGIINRVRESERRLIKGHESLTNAYVSDKQSHVL